MGRPKMLLPWGQTTVLGHLITVWKRVPAKQIGVVCAREDASIGAELDRLEFSTDARIINPNPERGMFSSIQCAAQWPGWRATLTHWAIVLGDQPHLQSASLNALARFAAQHPNQICQPSRHGHPRHPVLLPKTIFNRLAGSSAGTLKEFLQPLAGDVKLLELDDDGLDLDIDRPDDYQKALKLL